MTTAVQTFGLRPVFHPSGLDRATPYLVVDATQAAYGTALYKYAPVTWVTSGQINVAAASTTNWLGVMAGVDYTDSNGKFVQANFLPATPTGATNIRIWVWDDPAIVYDAGFEATGAALTNTMILDQANFGGTSTTASGSTTTGLSSCGLATTLAGAGVQGQVRILGIAPNVDNAIGDVGLIVRVQNANPQTVAPKVAI
jgi:hypothetical protein